MSIHNLERRDFLRVAAGGAVGFSLAYSVFGQQPPPAIKATKLSDNITLLANDGGNVAVIVGDDGLMMIDGGFANRADEMLKAVGGVDSHKVQILFDTHWHFDHTGCNETLGASGVKIIGHTNTKKWLSQAVVSKALNQAQNAPADRAFGPLKPEGLPKQTFGKGGKMTFGKEKIEYTYFPLAHTDSDVYLFFPNSNVLHTGDLFFNGFYPFIDYSTGGYIGGMAAAADALLKVGDAQTKIIPGHGPTGTKEDLHATRDMLHTVHERLEAMAKQGKTVDEVIVAAPTKDLDDKWGKVLPPKVFIGMAYGSIMEHKKSA
jgi:cyclase